MIAVDDATPEILKACRGEGPYDDSVRGVVAAVLRRHDLMHRGYRDSNGSLYSCIEHDIHEDVARAIESFFVVTQRKAEPERPALRRCTYTFPLPYWMGPDQDDPCPCILWVGHVGPHMCKHDED